MTESGKKRRTAGTKEPDENFWELKLYISGKTIKSMTAIHNLEKICEGQLKGRYRITVIDVSEHPELAFKEQIVVTPTLIRELPPPLRKIIGDLSRTEKVLLGLDLLPRPTGKESDAS